MNTIKSDRFKKVASKRVEKVCNAISSLEKCSNTYNYEYTEDDVKKMIAAIKSKYDEMRLSYKKGLSKKNEKFKF